MTQLLADPKLYGALLAFLAQVIGHFTGADPVTVLAYSTPIYVWILAHAHVQNGQGSDPTPLTPTPTKLGSATPVALLLFFAIAITPSLQACSGAQVVKTANCTAADADRIAQILDRKDLNGYEKIIQLALVGADVRECVLRSAAQAAASSKQ